MGRGYVNYEAVQICHFYMRQNWPISRLCGRVELQNSSGGRVLSVRNLQTVEFRKERLLRPHTSLETPNLITNSWDLTFKAELEGISLITAIPA